ncbi:uncharacterized protein LOC108257670 [Ictalurus punctatus]|uniref:Uncharacterized protein LOC108257670 n=1 Tax=Ictalurus punctatus TaxID=7998 RepID=A0A2D0PYH9_ICTPU|nr:uncharacterized protein LOC108257670 [Ictalurus punctatus]
MVDKKRFLVKHIEKIVQKTNNPMNLADALVGKNLIDQETLEKIHAQKTNQEKTRNIYMRLNSKTHFDCMYDWFKNKEPHLFEELENDDTEAEAPRKKCVRLEDEDETDNNLTGFPESERDLRTISTFAKLEEWVSKPEISQKMISDLERKLGDEGMAALRKELKLKEPRNSLCFNASNIDDIRKNKELERFLNTTQNAKFPKLTYDMWFKKRASASSGNRAQSSIDYNECIEAMTDLSSSGVGSSLNSSLNNSYSAVSFNYLPQNDDGLPDEDCRYTGDVDIMIHENKDKESEFKTPEKLLGGSFIQMDPEVNADAPSQEPVNMQNTHIDEMEERSQRSYVPNVMRNEDESLQQNQRITKKETPLDVELGSMDLQEIQVDEMDDEPQRSSVPNYPRHEDVSLHQNQSIAKNETPLKDGLGSTDFQDAHIDKMEEEPQRSNVLMHSASLHQNESVVKSKIPLEGRCGNMHMQQNEQENMQVNPGPFLSTQLQKNSPGSASEHTESNGTESSMLNKDTAILAKNGDVKDRIETSKKRANSKYQKEKKKEEKDKRLRDWALRQCNNREEDLKNIFDQISIINMAELSDYPCFTAENVMVYKYLTPESQIIFITDDNTSVKTRTTVHYQMFVCKIKRAILLGPKEPCEQEIPYKISQVPIDKCTDFIFKAFAPALTVYKEIQKEEKLYSLI